DGDRAQHDDVAGGDDVVGVDIENARQAVAVDSGVAAAGVLDEQTEVHLVGRGIGEDGELAGLVVHLAGGAGQADVVDAGDSQVDGVGGVAVGVGDLDGVAQRHLAGGQLV